MSMPFMPNNTLINNVVSVSLCVSKCGRYCVGVCVTGCHFVCVLESVCVNVHIHFFWNTPFVHVTYRSLCFCVNTKIWHSTHWKKRWFEDSLGHEGPLL